MEHLADLAVFARVAELKSFTAAADRLGLDRSVASKAIKRLEDRLGVRLLHRTTRRLSLTAAGERLFQRIAGALGEIESATSEVAGGDDRPRGKLRVALPMTFGLLHVAPALPEFLARYSQVTLDVVLEDQQTDLVAGAIDVALRIGKLETSSLVARRLAEVHHVLVASPAYFARHGIPNTPAELGTHRALLYSLTADPGTWKFTARDDREHRFEPNAVLSANNSLALRDALLAGTGLALIPRLYVAGDLAGGRLQEALTDYAKPVVGLHAVFPARRHVGSHARAFVDFLAARFGDPPYWDAPARRGRAAARPPKN
jgi:DNA-binding transcriptional LysR family regulator